MLTDVYLLLSQTIMKPLSRTALVFALVTSSLAPFALAENAPAANPSQESLLQSFDSLANTLTQAKSQMTQAVTERDQALHQLTDARNTLDNQSKLIEKLRKQLAESDQRAKEWEKSSRQQEAEANRWQKHAKELDERLAVGGKAQERLSDFNQRLNKTVAEFDSLQAELTRFRDSMKEPRQISELVKENESLKDAANKSALAMKQRSEAEVNLKKQIDQQGSVLKELEAKHQEFVAKAEARLKESNARETAAQARGEELAQQLEDTRSKLEASLRNQQKLTAELTENGKKLEALQKLQASHEASQEKAQKPEAEAHEAKAETPEADQAQAQNAE